MSAFAAAVSKAIREDVVRPLPSGTPRSSSGVRVLTGSLPATVQVWVDIDLPARARRIVSEIEKTLTARGYAVTPNPHDALMLTVSR